MAIFWFIILSLATAISGVRVTQEKLRYRGLGRRIALGVNLWLTIWFGWFSGLVF